MANIIKLGSLYLDNQPVQVGQWYNPECEILIGDTNAGQEISWVIVDRTMIADRCILTHVSWDDLNGAGLIFGKRILIDGFPYTITVPNSNLNGNGGEIDEWQSAMAIVEDESDSLWHWRGIYSWGKESKDLEQVYRVVRGYYAGYGWGYREASNRREDLGFRPMLLPEFSEFAPDIPPCSEMFLWIGESVIHGRLFELTKYDLVLAEMPGTNIAKSDIGQLVKSLPDGRLIVDRNSISTVQLKATK